MKLQETEKICGKLVFSRPLHFPTVLRPDRFYIANRFATDRFEGAICIYAT